MKTTTTITEKIINGLKKAAVELEELRVQAALGKADAKDKYEEAKKKFTTHLHDAKLNHDKLHAQIKEKAGGVKSALEEFRVVLALGKAEAKSVFNEHKKKIFNALRDFETIKNK